MAATTKNSELEESGKNLANLMAEIYVLREFDKWLNSKNHKCQAIEQNPITNFKIIMFYKLLAEMTV